MRINLGVVISGVPTVNRVVISVEEGKKDKNAPDTYELLLEGTDLGKSCRGGRRGGGRASFHSKAFIIIHFIIVFFSERKDGVHVNV